MSSEEKLPEELNKLKITTPLPPFKFRDDDIPYLLNPFYEPKTNVTGQECYKNLEQLCSRKQFIRQKSGHILEDPKVSAKLHTDLTSRVYKQPLKKIIGNKKRNFFIREPVLHFLQTVSQSQKVRRKIEQFALNNEETTNLKNCLSKGKTAIFDYPNSVIESQTLSEQNKRISHQYINQSDEIGRLKKISSIQSETQLRNSSIVDEYVYDKVTSDNYLALNNVITSSTVPVDYLNMTSRSSTSCSQQAGNGSANAVCDDVTIDELASYFDTLVHIPKKMSTMAEMMYI